MCYRYPDSKYSRKKIRVHKEAGRVKEVEKTIDDLCKLIQKKTENCKENYEVNELTELTKALAELITARAKLE